MSFIQIDGLIISKKLEARMDIQSSGSTHWITVDSQNQFIDTQFSLLDASVDQLELNQAQSFNYSFSTLIELDESGDISLAQMYLEESIMKLEFVNEIDHTIELHINSDDLTIDGLPLQLHYIVIENNQTQGFLRGSKKCTY